MLKVDTNLTKRYFKKFQFLGLVVIIIFLGLILTGLIVSFLPGVLFFLFFVLEKYVFKLSHMEEFSLLDIIATSLLYGIITFLIILFLGKNF